MGNDKKYYTKESIRLSELAKLSIDVPANVITECNDDRLLGMRVRGMLITKVKECDEYINHMKSFLDEEGKSNM